jgi:hypothetical protein
MKMASSGGSEDRKKIAAMAAFVVIAGALVYFEYFYTGAPATPAPVAATPAPAVSADNNPVAEDNSGPGRNGSPGRWERPRPRSTQRCTWRPCW